jgi:hypothetical protein
MTIPQADSTLVAIRKKVRRLTASASESSLKTADIDQYIQTYYNNDFPYSIKMDQMRTVYTFFTRPNIDRYPIDVNYFQGIRAPVYVEGIQGVFFKDRQQFFNVYPRFPTKQLLTYSPLTGVITNVTAATPASVTSANHGLQTGTILYISGVTGVTGVNGGPYPIVVTGTNTFTLTGTSSAGVYVSGGVWTSTIMNFNLPGPFLSKEVVIGAVDVSGNAVSVNDDGNGNLQLQVPNPVVSVPTAASPAPGMKNLNTGNPGQDITRTTTPPFILSIGSVNYVTGDFSINFPVAIDPSIQMTVWVSQYQTGRPYSLLFWNNELTIRPVPSECYKIEVEAYQTPIQFLSTTDVPILNQWWQLLALGSGIKILEDRQDMEGVQNLSVLFDRQEALCLERQAVEEIFQPNITLFNSSTTTMGLGASSLGYW